MKYQVSASDRSPLGALQLNEADPVKSVLQNIAVILSTPRGTVPLYREFGLDWTLLDKPAPVAKVLMVAEIREAIERWEPRAVVTDISFSENPLQPGVLMPIVEVEIIEQER